MNNNQTSSIEITSVATPFIEELQQSLGDAHPLNTWFASQVI